MIFIAQVPTKTIEVVPTLPISVGRNWTDVAYSGIRDGAWAIMLCGVVVYVAFKGSATKYLEKHLTLLDTMKESLSKNADSLASLSDAEIVQNNVLTRQGDSLEKQLTIIQTQQNAIMAIDTRQKEVVSKSLSVLTENTQHLATIADSTKLDRDEHQAISSSIEDLKRMSAHHQLEVIEKLQTIEDLYQASEIATGNKGTIKNFWGKYDNRK